MTEASKQASAGLPVGHLKWPIKMNAQSRRNITAGAMTARNIVNVGSIVVPG